MRSPRSARRGITFIEVMVASIIMVLAFFPLFNMIRGGVRRAKFQKIRAFATSLAQSYIERTRGCSLYYLDKDGPRADASDSPGVDHGHFWPEWKQFLDEDVLLNPKVGVEGVPSDPEMTDLLERWYKRAALFENLPMPISPTISPELEPMNMRVLAIAVYWGPKDSKPGFPETIEELKEGKNGFRYNSSESLTLATLTGEGLFHPPPALPGTI